MTWKGRLQRPASKFKQLTARGRFAAASELAHGRHFRLEGLLARLELLCNIDQCNKVEIPALAQRMASQHSSGKQRLMKLNQRARIWAAIRNLERPKRKSGATKSKAATQR